MKDGNITTHESWKVMEREINHNGLDSNKVSATSTVSHPDFVPRKLQQMRRIQKIICPYLSQTMNSVSAIQQNFPTSANGYFSLPVHVLERSVLTIVPGEKEEMYVHPQGSKEIPKLISLSTRYGCIIK